LLRNISRRREVAEVINSRSRRRALSTDDPWRVFELGDVAEIFDGPHATPKKTDRGPIFLGISNLVGGKLDLTTTEYIGEEDFVRWTHRVTPKAGDVVFSYETRLGEAAQIPSGLRCCLGRRMGLLRPNPTRVEGRFLLYAFLGPEFQETIRSRTIHGSTVDRIPLIGMPRFPIKLPEISQQRAIAVILGALDDKIELNRRTSETQEHIARALFKSWFIDFEPVRAKAEGRRPAEMGPDIAKLFPSDFVDSKVGPIPTSWTAGCVGDCVRLKRGTTYRGSLVGKPGPALLGLGSIRPGGGFRNTGFKTYGGDCPPELMLGPGELYVSLKGATKDGEMIGSVARVPLTVSSGRLTQDTVKLEFTDSGMTRYIYRLLLTPEYRIYCANRATGSAVVALSRDDFLSYPLVLPAGRVLDRFNSIVAALESRTEHCAAENVHLAATRDVLLQKLLSGELRIKDAERFVTE
jgi:type I restriction enzyme, S subunit